MIQNNPLSAPHLPLFDFFQLIRQWETNELSRQALTTSEYEWVINALDNCPFELKVEADYYRLCKLLWFKPYHAEKERNTEGVDDIRFNNHFKDFWKDLEKYNETPNAPDPIAPPPIEEKPRTPIIEPTPENPNLNIPPNPTTKPTPETTTQTTAKNDTGLSNVWVSTQDAERTAENAKAAEQRVRIARSFSFLEKNKFLPLEIRRLYQLLLSVRQVAFDGARNIPDFEATLKDFSRKGYLNEFSLRRQARSWMGVQLLIDHEGSMVAFEHMGDIMAEFVQWVGSKTSAVWYFHNCPMSHIFQDKNHFEAAVLKEWTDALNNKPAAQVIIFSDAGAARGGRNSERIQATENFLEKLKKHQVIWLNPMPQNRWGGTAAEDISRKVKMYDATDREFVAAMQRLKRQ